MTGQVGCLLVRLVMSLLQGSINNRRLSAAVIRLLDDVAEHCRSAASGCVKHQRQVRAGCGLSKRLSVLLKLCHPNGPSVWVAALVVTLLQFIPESLRHLQNSLAVRDP